MAAAVVPFGVVVGVTSSSVGVAPLASLVGAAAVYGGSAQLTATTSVALGGGVGSAVIAGLVVSARLLLYGAALEPWFRDQPRWFRWLAPQFIVDQTYLATVDRGAMPPAWFRRYWLAAGSLLLAVWVVAVASGTLLGPVLPPMRHIGLVGVALFTCLLVPRLVDRPAVVAAAAAGLTSLVGTWLLPGQGVLCGAAAGVVAGVLAEKGGRP